MSRQRTSKGYFKKGHKLNVKEKHPKWKGGRADRNGYDTIQCVNHPYANYTGYVRVHRLVMEKHLGRILLPTEIVHHINGDKTDNRIENLMLFSCNGDHTKHHCKLRKRHERPNQQSNTR